ncbi:hypothetical protein EVAR_62167_1 [Eumeta japonica]|uniref:Uncharacterized protein n=1 Tax=Eumeta variegata TaxID=151549 RepID=A0A4C1ZNW3_EUMVA|nr:hypothetical protein EVAR_62167_1 [Eumeta japonica]
MYSKLFLRISVPVTRVSARPMRSELHRRAGAGAGCASASLSLRCPARTPLSRRFAYRLIRRDRIGNDPWNYFVEFKESDAPGRGRIRLLSANIGCKVKLTSESFARMKW